MNSSGWRSITFDAGFHMDHIPRLTRRTSFLLLLLLCFWSLSHSTQNFIFDKYFSFLKNKRIKIKILPYLSVKIFRLLGLRSSICFFNFQNFRHSWLIKYNYRPFIPIFIWFRWVGLIETLNFVSGGNPFIVSPRSLKSKAAFRTKFRLFRHNFIF